MKVMFISDIHGSYLYAKKAIEIFEREKMDRLVILGDVLYHGPRNPLPQGYDCKKVAKLLNQYKDRIIAVRGNCDAEVDQMLLDFNVSKDYETLDVDGHHFFLSHGHIYNEENLPILNKGDIFVYGHIHKPVAKKKDILFVINPSSISLPKERKNSYGVYEKDTFTVYTFDRQVVTSIDFVK